MAIIQNVDTNIFIDRKAIIYTVKGRLLMRAKGNTGNQAPVAKKQASILGKASAISSKLRAAFKSVYPDSGNRKLMYRLNNVLQQWLRTGSQLTHEPVNDIGLLKGFSFAETGFGNILYMAMPARRSTDGNLLLSIPTFDSANPISPLPFAGEVKLDIIAASCNINDPADIKTFKTFLDINYTGMLIPAQELLLPLQTKPGYLTVVAVLVNGSEAGIVGALYN